MIILNDIFGNDLNKRSDDSSGRRIGQRIKEIRLIRGLSQAQLGEMIGLNGARIQSYESGVRKPKEEVLIKIADALKVQVMALSDADIYSYFGVVFALFEMEKMYDLDIQCIDGKIVFKFGDGISGTLNNCLCEWEKEKRLFEEKIYITYSEEERKKIQENYKNWKWNFPQNIIDKIRKSVKELKISQLQAEIDELNNKISELKKE